MKTFRLLGMALLAIVMCVNFASCSSDDDEEENNGGSTVVSGKLLLKMVGERTIRQFNYNEKKQLTSVSVTPRENNFNTETRLDIEWLNSKVLVKTSDRSFEEEAYFTIQKGVVTRADVSEGGGVWTNNLTYDKDNHLIKASDAENCTWSWQNGNVVKFTRYGNDGVEKSSTFTYYTDKENKHPVMDAKWMDFGYATATESADLLFLVYPKLLGTPNKNLLKSVTTVYPNGGESTQTTNFTYEFDSEGYPTKIIIQYEYGSESYTLIWD